MGGGLGGADGPHRLVRHEDALAGAVGDRRGDLVDDDSGRRQGVEARGLADAEQGDQVVAQRRGGLGAYHRVVLAEQAAAFCVADLDVRHAQLGQLGAGHLTGEGAGVLGREVLRAHLETRGPGRREGGRDRDERGEHDQLGRPRRDVGVARGQGRERGAVGLRSGGPEVHLQADRDGAHRVLIGCSSGAPIGRAVSSGPIRTPPARRRWPASATWGRTCRSATRPRAAVRAAGR